MQRYGGTVLALVLSGSFSTTGCGPAVDVDAGDHDAGAAADAQRSDTTAADTRRVDAGGQDAASADAATCVAATAVTVRNFRFDPECVKVSAGATVTWTNVGMATHTVTSDTGAPVSFNSGALGASGVFTFQFDSPSTVHYHCTPHQASGMVGTVVVE